MKYPFIVIFLAFLMSGCGGGGSGSDEQNTIIEEPEDENDNPSEDDPDADNELETGLIRDQQINVMGLVRNYHIYVPDTHSNAPIVFLFHGHSKSNDDVLGLNGQRSPYEVWLEIAARENLIVIVPNGYNNGTEKGWNDCRNDSTGNSREDDVVFIRELIDNIVEKYGADPARVFATGTSNGGHFSIRLGFEMPEKLTGFAAIVAANSVNTKCLSSVTPVSALFMNGTEDPFLPYDGGQMIGNRGEVYSAAATVSDWVSRNSTNTIAVTTSFSNTNSSDGSTVTKHLFLNGAAGTGVAFFRVEGGGHSEPSIGYRYDSPIGEQNGDIEMAEEVWSFFEGKRKQ